MKLESNRQPILESERLRLQPLTPADAPSLFAQMNDPEVMAYWDVPQTDDPDLVAAIVDGQVAAMASGKALHWSIRTLADDGFAGCCSLSEIDLWHKRAEVGFMLGRPVWGQGFALEAMRTVVAYAGVSGLRKLSARTHLGNRHSEAVLEQLGFKQEGLLRGHVVRDAERRDCRLFGLLL